MLDLDVKVFNVASPTVLQNLEVSPGDIYLLVTIVSPYE